MGFCSDEHCTMVETQTSTTADTLTPRQRIIRRSRASSKQTSLMGIGNCTTHMIFSKTISPPLPKPRREHCGAHSVANLYGREAKCSKNCETHKQAMSEEEGPSLKVAASARSRRMLSYTLQSNFHHGSETSLFEHTPDERSPNTLNEESAHPTNRPSALLKLEQLTSNPHASSSLVYSSSLRLHMHRSILQNKGKQKVSWQRTLHGSPSRQSIRTRANEQKFHAPTTATSPSPCWTSLAPSRLPSLHPSSLPSSESPHASHSSKLPETRTKPLLSTTPASSSTSSSCLHLPLMPSVSTYRDLAPPASIIRKNSSFTSPKSPLLPPHLPSPGVESVTIRRNSSCTSLPSSSYNRHGSPIIESSFECMHLRLQPSPSDHSSTGIAKSSCLLMQLSRDQQPSSSLDTTRPIETKNNGAKTTSQASDHESTNSAAPGTVRLPLRCFLAEKERPPWEGNAWEEVTEQIELVCCVCMLGPKGAAFVPCGHTFCRKCSRQIWRERDACPLCNHSIREVLDIF